MDLSGPLAGSGRSRPYFSGSRAPQFSKTVAALPRYAAVGTRPTTVCPLSVLRGRMPPKVVVGGCFKELGPPSQARRVRYLAAGRPSNFFRGIFTEAAMFPHPPIITRAEARAADAMALSILGLPSAVLMENAGRQLAFVTLSEARRYNCSAVAVIAARGNNGGDGLVASRHLRLAGFLVRVLLVNEAMTVSPDSDFGRNLRAAAGSGRGSWPGTVVRFPVAAECERRGGSARDQFGSETELISLN